MEFCDTLEGFYDNWKQSASNPTKYAHCIRWKRISDNELTSTQWYHHEGEDKPYRHRWHRVTDELIVQNWSNGGIVKSMVEFNGKTYRSKDQGWKDGQVVWGDDVIYEFDKL